MGTFLWDRIRERRTSLLHIAQIGRRTGAKKLGRLMVEAERYQRDYGRVRNDMFVILGWFNGVQPMGANEKRQAGVFGMSTEHRSLDAVI